MSRALLHDKTGMAMGFTGAQNETSQISKHKFLRRTLPERPTKSREASRSGLLLQRKEEKGSQIPAHGEGTWDTMGSWVLKY